jgi:hypothetical protein
MFMRRKVWDGARAGHSPENARAQVIDDYLDQFLDSLTEVECDVFRELLIVGAMRDGCGDDECGDHELDHEIADLRLWKVANDWSARQLLLRMMQGYGFIDEVDDCLDIYVLTDLGREALVELSRRDGAAAVSKQEMN